MRIPITKPCFGEREKQALLEPLESGWVVQGPRVREFEEKFAGFVGAPHSAALSSCTTALHAVFAALGLAPGDEVIVPAFTWISTANAVEYLGAKPIFCDIDLDGFNIDPRRIAALLTPRTVGIVPVHLFGLCADLEPIQDLARKHKLWVVEDAACAFGASYRGKAAGTFGEAGCFSFHPRKSITTGEGGMVTTSRKDLDQQIRILRDHGASRSDLERHQAKGFLLPEFRQLGYNYRMTDLQGALGCAQMERAEWILGERAKWARHYTERLAGLPWLKTPRTPEGSVHGYQAYVLLFQPEEPALSRAEALRDRRTRLMERLESQGIATRQGTHAPVIQKYYEEKYRLKREDFPQAVLADHLSLALPLYPQMTEAEADFVVRSLIRTYQEL